MTVLRGSLFGSLRGGAFRSLRGRNYRAWAAGALISNIGTWMQRVAQDWLVLTRLTHHDAAAVGVVMALQFGPQLLLLPLTGATADRFDRRRLLAVTQALMGLLALGLGLLTLSGAVTLWEVYLFAFMLGCVTAFDAPARQTFVAELVGEQDLTNAVALNSASFNAARMIGPAVAGLLIAAVGTGTVFLLNAGSFVAMLATLWRLDGRALAPRPRRGRFGLTEGFRTVWRRRELRIVLTMLFLVGTFGLNFTIFIATMAVDAFRVGAGRYGGLTAAMAAGSVMGALWVARLPAPGGRRLVVSAFALAVCLTLAATMPDPLLFALVLVAVGLSAQTFTTSTNSMVQLATEPSMRGRVLAILLAIAMGGAPIGSPLVGFVANRFGPRWGLMVGALGCAAAGVLGLRCGLFGVEAIGDEVQLGRGELEGVAAGGAAAKE